MKKVLYFLMLLVTLSTTVDAKYHWISNEDEFKERLNQYEFVLVCFLRTRMKVDGKVDRDHKEDAIDLRKTIQAAANSHDYKKWLKKEVGFLIVDVTKDFGLEIAQSYNLVRFPRMILFKNAKLVADRSNSKVILEGFVSKSDILEFLDDYLGSELDEVVDQKKEEDRLDRQERIAQHMAYRWNPYPSYRYGWGPYGYYGPRYYYDEPRFYFGVSV